MDIAYAVYTILGIDYIVCFRGKTTKKNGHGLQLPLFL